MAYIPNSGSVVAFQSQPSSLLAGVSVIGLTPVNVTNTVNVSGSVATFITGNSSVISTIQGSVAVAIVSGSIAATFTPPANQSVSGTVGASIIGLPPVNVTNTVTVVSSIAGGIFPISGSVAATIVGTPNVNTAGSVVAFQGGAPWANTNVGSVITVGQGSIAVAIIAGSIAATFTPPANQSVSGTVQTDVRGSIAAVIIGGSIATATTNSSVMLLNGANVIGSVAALQGTNPWIVTSSIAGGIFPISGSVAATIVGTPNVNVAGSVVAFQGGAPWANTNVGSIITASQGSIAAVIIGGSIATATTNSSVMLLTGTNMVGSVAAYQGSIPWTIGSIYGNISGSVAATITNTNVNVSGSVVSFQGGTQITSISGVVTTSPGADTVPATSSILVGVTANTNGSVVTVTGYQMAMMQITSGPGASITGAINFEGTADGTQFVPIQGYNISNNAISSMATIESDWAFNIAGLQGMRARVSNWTVGSITARVNLSPEDARPFAILAAGNQSVSGQIGASIIGQLPAGTAPIGSVAVLQGTNPWVETFSNSSILAVPVGSVTTVFGLSPSIVGTYAEDAASASADKGVFTLGVRNDTLSSVTSADGDYGAFTVGPMGEAIMANSPITKWVYGVTSIVSGPSVAVIAAQGASIFTYVTAVQIVNPSANNIYLNLSTGAGAASILAYMTAPANGGSNMVFPNPLRSRDNTAILASISGVGSVLISMQGFISKLSG